MVALEDVGLHGLLYHVAQGVSNVCRRLPDSRGYPFERVAEGLKLRPCFTDFGSSLLELLRLQLVRAHGITGHLGFRHVQHREDASVLLLECSPAEQGGLHRIDDGGDVLVVRSLVELGQRRVCSYVAIPSDKVIHQRLVLVGELVFLRAPVAPGILVKRIEEIRVVRDLGKEGVQRISIGCCIREAGLTEELLRLVPCNALAELVLLVIIFLDCVEVILGGCIAFLI